MYRGLQEDGFCGSIYTTKIECLIKAFKDFRGNLRFRYEPCFNDTYEPHFTLLVYVPAGSDAAKVAECWEKYDQLASAQFKEEKNSEIELSELRQFLSSAKFIAQKLGVCDEKDSVL